MNLSKAQLIKFHVLMARELGVKFVGDPGFIQRLWQRLLERIFAKYASLVPDSVYRLRPMCFKNIIFLPYMPGCSSVPVKEQIRVAVHEATHALRIRNYPGRVSNWYGEYFTNERFRGLQETSAIQASAEVEYWMSGTLLNLNLNSYLVSEETSSLCQNDFDRQIRQMQRLGRGSAMHIAAGAAINILRNMS